MDLLFTSCKNQNQIRSNRNQTKKQSGKFNITRTLALTGSQFNKPSYVSVLAGASISAIVDNNINLENTRIISGNVLSGSQVEEEGFVGYYDNQITAIPEGDDYEFFGWNKPVFNKISPSRALTFSWLTPKKKYDLNTNTNGEHRAFVVTGSYENVFPLDMFPLQFLKALDFLNLFLQRYFLNENFHSLATGNG